MINISIVLLINFVCYGKESETVQSTHDVQRTKRTLMQFAEKEYPTSACVLAQAGLDLRCPLAESTDTVVMSTNRECPDQTARMRILVWT